jgi:hypothetical protein
MRNPQPQTVASRTSSKARHLANARRTDLALGLKSWRSRLPSDPASLFRLSFQLACAAKPLKSDALSI